MKKILITAGIGIALATMMSRKKVANTYTALKGLALKVNGISDLKIKSNGLQFNLDINITNTSPFALSVDSFGSVKLSKLTFKTINGTPLGDSFPNITNIEIPAGQTLQLPNVPTLIPISNIGGTINAMLSAFKNPDNLVVSSTFDTPVGQYTV